MTSNPSCQRVDDLYCRRRIQAVNIPRTIFRHPLPYMYDGTNHVFFNGSLYYHRFGTPNIVRYDVILNQTEEVEIHPQAAHKHDQVGEVTIIFVGTVHTHTVSLYTVVL